MKLLIPLILSLAVATCSAQAPARASAPLELFADGETVCFLGDSITAGGYVQTLISDYYLTRFPDRTVKFVNAGRSGDSANGSLNRLQEDVIDNAPTSVAIMFGMNDVNRGSYVSVPDEARIASQQSALSRYEEKMGELVTRIRSEAGDPKLIFQTPSPFDETVQLDRDNNQPGCNEGLANCARIVRALAKANDGLRHRIPRPDDRSELAAAKGRSRLDHRRAGSNSPGQSRTPHDGLAVPESPGSTLPRVQNRDRRGGGPGHRDGER